MLTEEKTNNAVIIRKDAFFSVNNGSFVEYSPDSGKIPDGVKIGAYHVKIGGDFKDIKDMNTTLEEIKHKGIDVYPAYTDKWEIWTGFYIDENGAKMSILHTIDTILGSNDYEIVPPSPTRITALSEDGQVMLLFDSQASVFQVHPIADNGIKIFRINNSDDKRYRGELEVRRLSGSDMTVVNILPTEQYLYGVVPYEIQASSHPEALKAQAVSARTYTLNNVSKYIRLGFNMCTTVNSQVYKGYNGEAASTNKAVDDTKGQIVTYNGKPASVFYFSSSGGCTEDVKNVWGSDGYPYLKSVEDKYESGNSWHYNWEVSYTAQKIKQVMTDRGYNLGDIVAIDVTKRSEAGRAIELAVRGTKDNNVYKNGGTRNFLSLDSQWYYIYTDADVALIGEDEDTVQTQLGEKKVMTAAGLKTIKANNKNAYVISSSGKKNIQLVPTLYTFKRRGWGHAVGMSQEGSKGMADNGYKYDQILTHYFVGTKVE